MNLDLIERPRLRSILSGTPCVYLIHLHAPLKHARHYVGFSRFVRSRIRKHRRGHGDSSCFMKAVHAAGIRWTVVRVWQFETVAEGHAFERYLKSSNAVARSCPRCARARRRASRDSMRRMRAKRQLQETLA